ncbi:MAG: hypothetical protein GY795_43380 [Desulfobacterales bacterium]|nr:hypothetical protein [Desulfobacterales bacterium]
MKQKTPIAVRWWVSERVIKILPAGIFKKHAIHPAILSQKNHTSSDKSCHSRESDAPVFCFLFDILSLPWYNSE